MNFVKINLPLTLFLCFAIFIIFMILLNRKTNSQITNQYTTINFTDFKFTKSIESYELNENSVICFFSSSCSICSYEAQQLQKEKHIPENLDFIWVSAQNQDSILSFVKANHLENNSHFKFAQIDSTLLVDKYKVSSYPRGLIYKNGILCHSYKGIITLNRVQDFLNKDLPNQ